MQGKSFTALLTVEHMHLFTGVALIVAGLLSYPKEGVGMMLSWSIFGAMYISMSDIGEGAMSPEQKSSHRHRVRTFAAYLGAALSIGLLSTFL